MRQMGRTREGLGRRVPVLVVSGLFGVGSLRPGGKPGKYEPKRDLMNGRAKTYDSSTDVVGGFAENSMKGKKHKYPAVKEEEDDEETTAAANAKAGEGNGPLKDEAEKPKKKKIKKERKDEE